MSDRSWTLSQQSAISHRGSDLLVSASAGSGKTATLTARLIDLLCSPQSDVEPSQVLAVTFTKAAAGEMRQRLFSAASDEVARSPKNERARRLLTSIDRVQITTIHSFCRSAIKPYFASLGLAPDFRVTDEAEARMISERAMNDVVTALFNGEGEDLAILADALASSKDEAALDQTLLSLCASLENKGAGASDLEKYADTLEENAGRDVFETPFGDVIRSGLSAFGEHYEKLFSHYLPLISGSDADNYAPECERDALLARSVALAASGTYKDARDTVSEAANFKKLPSVPADSQTEDSLEFKAYRNKFKKELDALKEKYFSFTDGEIESSLRRTAMLERAVANVLRGYERRRTEIKRERNAVDFGNLERLAHRLFVGADGKPTDAARECAARYRYVFIDEYQDTNRLQDEIFRAVSSASERFMVGDVKQSIYAFRGADPTVFSDLRGAFSRGDGGSYVTMSENFRSASNVISYTNAVSRRMFPFSGTPFDESDELIFARKSEDSPDKCELVLLSDQVVVRGGKESAGNGSDSGEYEAVDGMSEERYVALRTRELIDRGTKPDGTPVRPGDIAVIIHSANVHAKGFADELTKLGIPVSVGAKRDMFADGTMLTLICLLNAVCSCELDVYFTGALKSTVFGFSLADTVRLRLDHPSTPMCAALEECAAGGEGELGRKCRFASETLRSLRSFSTLLSPDAFIRHMAKTLDLESVLAVGGASRPAVRRAIRELRTVAAQAATGGAATLVQFMSYLSRMMEKGESVEASAPAEDAVNIISIHHSKGLEFPVCFVTSAAKSFNVRDASSGVVFDPAFGIAARLPDPSGLVKCDTLLRRITSERIIRAKTDEEMRTLYVAMTRARDKLIVVASVKDAEAELRAAKKSAHLRSEYFVREANGYLRWLLAPLADGEECGAVAVAPELSANADSLTETTGYDAQTGTPSALSAGGEPAPGESSGAADEESDDRGSVDGTSAGKRTVDELCELFARRFDFEYPYAHLAKIPAKLTVSRLYPEILDEEPEIRVAGAFTPADRAPVPRFMSAGAEESAGIGESAGAGGASSDGELAARIGTATHVFMQFCDFDRLVAKDGENVDALVEAELSRLLAERFIDKQSAALVDLSRISAFVRSPLFGRILSARRVWREFRFNAARSAAGFTADADLAKKLADSGEDVIVQGVVDLLFEDSDGRFVLVDYKTDRLTDYERAHPEEGKKTLRLRHKNQLTYYRDIVGEMTPRPIDETLVYSLILADTVAID